MSSAANPSAVSSLVVLGPEHKCAEVAALLSQGRTHAEAVRSWAMSFVLDMSNHAEVAALLSMVPLAAFIEINAKQTEYATKRKASVNENGLRVTFSEAGRVVLNGLKINSSAEGKGGAPLSLFPAQLSTLIDGLPLFIQTALDNAETLIPANATDQDVNPEYDAMRKAGKSDAEIKSAGVKRFIQRPHKRAGQTAMAWDGCDKTATVAKLRSALEALRTMKPVAELKA